MADLPESAVELAVLAYWRDCASDTQYEDSHSANLGHMRAALTAALPAIREAVGREYAGLVDKWREQAAAFQKSADYWLAQDDHEKAQIMHEAAHDLNVRADELAALATPAQPKASEDFQRAPNRPGKYPPPATPDTFGSATTPKASEGKAGGEQAKARSWLDTLRETDWNLLAVNDLAACVADAIEEATLTAPGADDGQ